MDSKKNLSIYESLGTAHDGWSISRDPGHSDEKGMTTNSNKGKGCVLGV